MLPPTPTWMPTRDIERAVYAVNEKPGCGIYQSREVCEHNRSELERGEASERCSNYQYALTSS